MAAIFHPHYCVTFSWAQGGVGGDVIWQEAAAEDKGRKETKRQRVESTPGHQAGYQRGFWSGWPTGTPGNFIWVKTRSRAFHTGGRKNPKPLESSSFPFPLYAACPALTEVCSEPQNPLQTTSSREQPSLPPPLSLRSGGLAPGGLFCSWGNMRALREATLLSPSSRLPQVTHGVFGAESFCIFPGCY